MDTIVWAALKAIVNNANFDFARFTPARMSEYMNSSAAIADGKILLSQIALTASIVFAAILVFIALKRRQLVKPATSVAPTPEPDGTSSAQPVQGAQRERWNEVLGHLDSPRENDWKLAVMEADKLIDKALQQAGFPGDTFGDRLTNIQPGSLLSLDGLWWAHRIRNRVAHEMDYFLRYTEARQAISYYEAALSELQLI
jgi:hypothetical protein